MNEADVIDLGRQGVVVMLKMAAPMLLTALTTGVLVSLFQTLTHIQEMTLTFVPKIVAVFIALTVFLPYMLSTLSGFMYATMDIAANGG